MPSIVNRGEPLILFDPKVNYTLRRMENKHNPVYVGDVIIRQPPPPVEAHHQVVVENQNDDAVRMQPPIPHPQEFYRGNVNINYFDRTLVLPRLPMDIRSS